MKNLSAEQLFLTEAAQALLENQDQSLFLNLARYQLWDLGGLDSLQLMKRLVSDVVAQVSSCESIDFIFTGYQYSALHLGESNFRLGLYGELGAYGGLNFEETIRDAIATPIEYTSGLHSPDETQTSHAQVQTALQTWARHCVKIKAIALPASVALDLLPKIAVVEPPTCLEELQPNHATAVTIDGMSVLIWRHQLLSQPIVELHVGLGDAEAIELKLINRYTK
jgi:hypothetical protein